MKRFILAFLAALIVVGGIVAIGMTLRPGDQSTGFFEWIDELDSDGIHLGDGSNGLRNLKEVELDDSIEWNQESEIRIDSEVSDVQIIQGDSSKIEVQTTGKVSESIEAHMELSKTKDGIVIRIWQDRPKTLIANTTNLDTVVTLPKDFAGDLVIKTDVGDLDFGDYVGESLVVDSDVGDVVGEAKADTIEIESNVGGIHVTVNGGDIILKSDVGEVVFESDQADSILASSDVGEIDATLSKNLIDAGIAADSDIGDVNAGVAFKETKDKDATVQLYTSVGEIDIHKK